MSQSHEFLTPQQILQHAICFENGIVNFRMLHTLLHILINNIDSMDTYRIELRTDLHNNEKKCDFSENVMESKPSIVLTENLVGKDGKKSNAITKKSTDVVNKIISESSKYDTTPIIVVSGATSDPVDKSRSETSMATVQIDDATNVKITVAELDAKSHEKQDEITDKKKDNYGERLNELENAIKSLTVNVNDLSRNFHVFQTTRVKCDEIGQLMSKLNELEKQFYEKHGNDSVSPAVMMTGTDTNEVVVNVVSQFLDAEIFIFILYRMLHRTCLKR